MKIMTRILTFSCLFILLYVSFAFGQINWVKYSNNPVFYNGYPGNFDDAGVYAPYILKDEGIFKMWYTGFTSWPYYDRIGYAESLDGVTWARNDVPVLKPDTSGWDSVYVLSPFVLTEGDTLKMWYLGTDIGSLTNLRIGYATSINGVEWDKHPNNPVISYGPAQWESETLGSFSVLYDNNSYHMWYSGKENIGRAGSRIGYATSADGISWTKSNEKCYTTSIRK